MPRRSSGFSRAPRRKKSWEAGPGQLAVQSAIAANGSSLVVSGAQATVDGLTLLRLRGTLTLTLQIITSAIDGFAGAFGIGIVTLPAFTAGEASVPTPITEQDWDGWLYWTAFSMKGNAAGIGDAANAVNAQQIIDVDTKAMRKLRLNDVIYGAIEVAETGTAQLGWHFDSRALIALS